MPLVRTLAPSFALVAVPMATSAEPAMHFPGRVEPSRRVIVANHVTVSSRTFFSRALATSGAATPAEMFATIDLTLTLPSGETYPHSGRPLFESAALDPETGTLTVWGVFPNPDRTLVPNLPVHVTAVFRREARP